MVFFFLNFQKESSTSSLKWQKELLDANNKITDLTKKCKSLTEELMGLKKQSDEVQESKKVSKQLFKITRKHNVEKKSVWQDNAMFASKAKINIF